MKDLKLKELEAENKKLKMGWQRTQADFVNYKNRIEKMNNDQFDMEIKNFLIDFLPIADNLEKSIEHLPSELKNNDWIKGIIQISSQITDFMKKNNINKLETKIKDRFDVAIHEAILSEEKTGFREGEITKIIQSGYERKGKVLRPVQVKVAK